MSARVMHWITVAITGAVIGFIAWSAIAVGFYWWAPLFWAADAVAIGNFVRLVMKARRWQRQQNAYEAWISHYQANSWECIDASRWPNPHFRHDIGESLCAV